VLSVDNSAIFLLVAVASFLEETEFKKTNYSFKLLESKMLEIAKYPIMLYKLNFGNDDRIGRARVLITVTLPMYVGSL
jgi:hypothetical protein